MKRTKTIGQGVDFMNRHLSSSLSRDPAHGGINGSLFEYLKTFTYAGTCFSPFCSVAGTASACNSNTCMGTCRDGSCEQNM